MVKNQRIALKIDINRQHKILPELRRLEPKVFHKWKTFFIRILASEFFLYTTVCTKEGDHKEMSSILADQ
jgi:hypothetical protein